MAKYEGILDSIKTGIQTVMSDRTDPLVKHVFVTPAASVKVDPSDSYQELMDIDACTGNKVLVLKYLEKQATNVSWDYDSSSIDAKAAAMGKRMKKVASDVAVPFFRTWFNVLDVASPTSPASTLGVYGEGVVADVISIGSVKMDGIDIPLVQQNFAGFSAAAPLSFAVGADGAMKFSEDLRGRVVSIGGALHTLANIWSSDGANISVMSLQHSFITHQRALGILDIPSISLERSGFSIGDPKQSFKGIINGDFRLIQPNKKNRC